MNIESESEEEDLGDLRDLRETFLHAKDVKSEEGDLRENLRDLRETIFHAKDAEDTQRTQKPKTVNRKL